MEIDSHCVMKRTCLPCPSLSFLPKKPEDKGTHEPLDANCDGCGGWGQSWAHCLDPWLRLGCITHMTSSLGDSGPMMCVSQDPALWGTTLTTSHMFPAGALVTTACSAGVSKGCKTLPQSTASVFLFSHALLFSTSQDLAVSVPSGIPVPKTGL